MLMVVSSTMSICGSSPSEHPGSARVGGQIRVAEDVLEVEAEVFGGEGFAVGPSVAFAQVEGEGGLIVRYFIGAGDIGDDAGQIGVDREQLLQAHLQDVPATASRVGGRAGQLAAIFADGFQRLDDCRLGRQALFDRRQFAGGD